VAWILAGGSILVTTVTVAAIALFAGNGVVWASMPGWVGVN
jgi:hypothetical protein